jgi:cyanophycinase
MKQNGQMNKYIFLLLFLFSLRLNGQIVGPENGTLVIVGGGKLSDTILLAFIEASGGNEAPILVIPTALGQPSYTENEGDFLRKLGAKNVKVWHTDNKSMADSDSFVNPIRNAKGIWFTGGRQWRLVDSYAGTASEKAFWEVLENDGVIGGTSAGASIQGDYLIRGDTKNNTILMGDHEKGFAFLKNVVIDQHVLARNRSFDLPKVLEKLPTSLGIGLDENTAMVVKKDTFSVIGESYLLVYDKSTEHPFYFLKKGDKYDLQKRQVITPKN